MSRIRKKIANKKIAFIAVFLAIASLAGIGGIFAYLSDADRATNVMTIGGNRIELIEEFDPPEELKPGTSFTKDVHVENVGPNDCFVRIKAVFTDSDMEKYCTVDWNTNDFEYNEADGFYYYKKVLKSGKTTPSLFTTVTLSDKITQEEIKEFDILVYTESFQSYDFEDYTAAWDYYERNKPTN